MKIKKDLRENVYLKTMLTLSNQLKTVFNLERIKSWSCLLELYETF